jgi:hypothetical protein
MCTMPHHHAFVDRKWIPSSWVILTLDAIQFGAVALIVLPLTIVVWWVASTVFGARGRP